MLAAEVYQKSRESKIANTTVLIERGADVNAADNEGATPLMFAAARDCVEVVEILLDAAADINAVDDN